ncbi:hypothetical protein, partial [Bacteroides heparinolyticus]
ACVWKDNSFSTGEKRKTPMRKLPVRRREFFISNFGITRVRGRRFLLLKVRGLHPVGQIFLECTGLQRPDRREPFTPLSLLPLF